MNIMLTDQYIAIFGDRLHGYEPALIAMELSDTSQSHVIKEVKDTCEQVKALVVLHQTHSSNGVSITTVAEAQAMRLLETEGDYLITNVPDVMLGILSADCLPVLVYDHQKKVVGAAHAGWRGSVAGVLYAMMQHMQKEYGSLYKDLFFQFGPSAKVCCYQVDQLFVDHISGTQEGYDSLVMRNGQSYFDLPRYNLLKLKSYGISLANVDMHSSICTICDQKFNSYRRDKTKLRQMSAISLK